MTAASVVICSRGRPRMLRDTVGSVLAGESVPEELVIVDQSATADPELAEMGEIRGCRVRYLHSSTTGLSRARNIGLRAAEHPVAVLIDDDMFVEKGWLAELLAAPMSAQDVVATGRVLAAPSEGAAAAVPPAALVERSEPAAYRGPQTFDVVPGANVALPRKLVLELGGYDERLGAGTRFSAADDNDIGHRLLLAGCEVRHLPSAVTLHRAWRNRRELIRLRWRYGRGKGAFYAKHTIRGDRWIRRRAAADLRRRLSRAARSALRSPRVAAVELVSTAGIIAGAVDWSVTVTLPELVRGRDRSPG